MQRAPVIPNYEIPRHPFVSMDELGLRGVLHQFVNQHSPVRNWLPDDVRGMRGKIQCLASRTGMNPDKAAMDWWICESLFFGELGEPKLGARNKNRMLGLERVDARLHLLRQRLIRRTGIDELCLAGFGCDGVGVQQGIFSGRFLE